MKSAREIGSGKRLGTENRSAERDRRERHAVVVVAAGAVATDVQLRFPFDRADGTQSGGLASSYRQIAGRSWRASMSGSTACHVVAVVGRPPGGDRHIADAGAPGATGDTRENHCLDGDSGFEE